MVDRSTDGDDDDMLRVVQCLSRPLPPTLQLSKSPVSSRSLSWGELEAFSVEEGGKKSREIGDPLGIVAL